MNQNNSEIIEDNVQVTTDEITQDTKSEITQEIRNALNSEEVRQLIYENDEIVNEVIERYLRSLSGSSVPVVRGLSALTPVPKPKTLSEAKAIVDGR